MSLDTDIALLQQVPLFEELDREQLRLLAFGAETRRLAAGGRLFREGAFSEGGYLVRQGQLELKRGGNKGILVETLYPGMLVGEMALITPTDHSTTAIAPQGGEVMKIPRPLFRRMLEEYPDLTERLQERIANEVQGFVARLGRIQRDLDRADGL